jgi:FADH2 O2-dependent halogenase
VAPLSVDVAILGSGFGGSITALVLARLGLRVVLVDRASHPRFAIGESSTPVADYVLADLARRYDVPRLAPLAKYGTWQRAYPQLVCGIKRGFSYFSIPADAPFAPRGDHANELLVAASSDDEHSDTHWLRSDVDAFLAAEAQEAGVELFDRTKVSVDRGGHEWQLDGKRLEQDVHIRARFVIDATGEAGVLQRTLGIGNEAERLATNSRALFAHFADMRPWHDVLASAGGAVGDHPFYCDHAALHHLFDEGWMWQLRFNNGITSAGFAIDCAHSPIDDSLTPEQEWAKRMHRYPSVAQQFERARLVAPAGGLRRTGRLQRLAARMVGDNWALLPNTAGFIDPLHSTGIAQTLCGIERLAGIFQSHWGKPSLGLQLTSYDATVRRELLLVDKLVSGCYLARRRFRLFAAFAMFYFAGATTYERRRHAGEIQPGAAFLCADESDYCRAVDHCYGELRRLLATRDMTNQKPSEAPGRDINEFVSDADVAAFELLVSDRIAPFNTAGLCDRAAHNMYRHTAAPRD